MKPICTITITDEVHAKLTGLGEAHLMQLYEMFGVFTDGYMFNIQFKIGAWDGKRRFVNMDGTTYTYMLEEVLKYVIAFGYSLNLVDNRIAAPPIDPIAEDIFSSVLHPDTGEPTILRDYQVNAVNSVLRAGYGIILAATSAGKTLICAALCSACNQHQYNTVTIVPNNDLLKQTFETYEMCGLDVGTYSGTSKDIDHTHIISTWQALKNVPFMMHEFDVVIVDECHGVKGPLLRSLLVDHGKHIPHRIGVTGTLPKSEVDTALIKATLGPIRYEIPAAELIDRGVLAQPHITITVLEEDLSKQYEKYLDESRFGKPIDYKTFKEQYFPEFPAEKDYLNNKTDRAEWIADRIIAERNANPNHNTLVLVNSIPFARKLAKLIPGGQVVNGQDVKDATKRSQIYQQFKTETGLVVVATVHIASTGLNIPKIHYLVLVDIGKSYIRVIQSIGRGLRKAKGKDAITIHDICSDLGNAKRHLTMRKAYYREAKYPFKLVTIKY